MRIIDDVALLDGCCEEGGGDEEGKGDGVVCCCCDVVARGRIREFDVENRGEEEEEEEYDDDDDDDDDEDGRLRRSKFVKTLELVRALIVGWLCDYGSLRLDDDREDKEGFVVDEWMDPIDRANHLPKPKSFLGAPV